jgi:predicted PurR-regulated permease PerM
VGGVIGVYLSIPIAATLRIFWRRWQAYKAASGVPPAQSVPQKRSA